ncbi:MAG: hypothetical protein CSA62_09300 [Planctomycetota bacterium]|nr:MAG: hypothetical protein CSA62_09300 [Planctomycetota bacterium]
MSPSQPRQGQDLEAAATGRERMAEILPTLLELGCQPPFLSLDELGRWRVPSEFGDFRGHQVYTPGDDLRFLDWRVLARTGDRMLKRFDGVEHRRLLLHLDCSASCGTRAEGLRDLVSIWLLLALQALDSAELVLHGPGERLQRFRFEGPADAAAVRSLVQSLRFDGQLDAGRVADALAQSSGAVLVSDFMPTEFWREVLTRAAGPGRSILCAFPRAGIECTAGEEHALRGSLRLEDPETGRRLRVDASKRLLQAFAAEQRAWEREMAALCRESRHLFWAADLPRAEARFQVESWLPFLLHPQRQRRDG